MMKVNNTIKQNPEQLLRLEYPKVAAALSKIDNLDEYNLYNPLAKSIYEELNIFDNKDKSIIEDNNTLLKNITDAAMNAYTICNTIKKIKGIKLAIDIGNLIGISIPFTVNDNTSYYSISMNKKSEVLLNYDNKEMKDESDKIIIIRKDNNKDISLMIDFKDDHTDFEGYYELDREDKDNNNSIYGINNIAKNIIELYTRKININSAL